MKLALTLRYLASGESYPSLVTGFRVSKTMVTCTVPEVCNALIAVYQDKHMKCPEMLKNGRRLPEASRRDGTSHMQGGPLMGSI
jgi:hypothetical protein